VIGAVVFTATPEFFRDYPGFQEVVLAVLIILVLLFLPRGLVSLLARRVGVFRDRYYLE